MNILDSLLRNQSKCPICQQSCNSTLYYDENDEPKTLDYCGFDYCLQRIMKQMLENELKKDQEKKK